LTEHFHIPQSNNKLVSLAAAIIAVLAALGTLFAHHRSISALTAKNQAILMQARASDAYGQYEAKRIRVQLGQALYDAGIPSSSAARVAWKKTLESEDASLGSAKARAENYEAQSERDDVRSEKILKSYEILEFATTLFEISIVLVSFSALVSTRAFLTVGCLLSAVGLVSMIVGLTLGN
jgi:hypothetical protein